MALVEKKLVPNISDWGDCSGDLDLADAFNKFFGKTNEEMMVEYMQDPIEVFSNFRWMPISPFLYYIYGYADAVIKMEKDSYVNSDAASCFLDVIRLRSSAEPSRVSEVYDDLLPKIEYIVENQSSFDADIDIYGEFKDMHSEIKANMNR